MERCGGLKEEAKGGMGMEHRRTGKPVTKIDLGVGLCTWHIVICAFCL